MQKEIIQQNGKVFLKVTKEKEHYLPFDADEAVKQCQKLKDSHDQLVDYITEAEDTLGIKVKNKPKKIKT
jgi:hypothetical protein